MTAENHLFTNIRDNRGENQWSSFHTAHLTAVSMYCISGGISYRIMQIVVLISFKMPMELPTSGHLLHKNEEVVILTVTLRESTDLYALYSLFFHCQLIGTASTEHCISQKTR